VFVVIGPARRGLLVYRAIHSRTAQTTEALLNRAVAVDRLSPDAAMMAARLLTEHYQQSAVGKDPALLQKALAFAEIAIARTPADPRPRQLKGDIFLAAAEQNPNTGDKQAYQQEAYRAFEEAVQQYPGSDRLNYKLGVLAEELNRPEEAMAYLQAALDIEMRYREQFVVMYPDQKEVVSRLGPSVYDDVLKRLERLKSKIKNQPAK